MTSRLDEPETASVLTNTTVSSGGAGRLAFVDAGDCGTRSRGCVRRFYVNDLMIACSLTVSDLSCRCTGGTSRSIWRS